MNVWEQRDPYRIKLIDGSKQYWIENLVTSMSWSGSTKEASRNFDFECIKLPDKSTVFPEGSTVIVYDNIKKIEFMRFIITKKSISSNSETIKYTGRDIRWWLIRSKMDKKFVNKTATQIVMELCKTLGIPTGSMAHTGVKFSTLYFVKKSPWDMIVTAFTETKKQNGRKFVLRVTRGKLEVVEKIKQIQKWIIEEGVNLLDSTYEESIENMYTQVKVSGKDKNGKTLTTLAKNSEKQKLYGLMQEYIEQSGETTQAKINSIAVQKLKELSALQKSGSVSTIGINGVEAGNAIYVKDKQTGLVGGFYVSSDSHSYSNGYHSMNLTLSWTDELPALDYEKPKEPKKKKTTKKKKKTTSTTDKKEQEKEKSG